jgi:hypothetical protein
MFSERTCITYVLPFVFLFGLHGYVFPQGEQIDELDYINRAIVMLTDNGIKVNLITFKTIKTIETSFLKQNPSLKEQYNHSSFGHVGFERRLLNTFGMNPNFCIIDRSNIEKAMKEMELQNSGIIAPETITQIGSIIGANYLLNIVDSVSFNSPDSFDSDEEIKLIEIGSMKVLAVGSLSFMRISDNDKRYIINGRDAVYDNSKDEYFLK